MGLNRNFNHASDLPFAANVLSERGSEPYKQVSKRVEWYYQQWAKHMNV